MKSVNKFGWFMNGCYVTSILTAILLDFDFVIPFWIYLLLVIGIIINNLSQRGKW